MTRHFMRIYIIMLCALVLAGCGQAGRYSGTLITEGDHRISQGERLQAGVLMLDGRLTIEPDAIVEGSIVMLNGEIQLEGDLLGDLSMLDGQLQLGAQAKIDGDLLVAAGDLERDPGAQVAGAVHQGELGASAVFGQSRQTNPTVLSLALRTLIQALLAVVVVRLLPKPVAVVSQALSEHALASMATGVFAALIGLILMVQMIFTVVLVPMSLIFVLFSLVAVGLTSIFYGHALGKYIRSRQAWISMPWAVGVGTAAYTLLTALIGLVPYLGAALQLLLKATGLGALILTRLGLRRYQAPTDPSLI